MGSRPILDYLGKLPYAVQTKCDAGHYYPAVNIGPAWNAAGHAKRSRFRSDRHP